MDGWKGLAAAGADELKLEPAPIKPQLDKETQRTRPEDRWEEGEPAEPMSIIMKKEDISDVPCKVPKFQYVDFPFLHQCIQQLAIPPLESWLARCPAGWPPSRGSRDTTERVPKFKYVDYPSLHHCIQQLSVPPLESWSSGPLRSSGSSSSLRLGTGTAGPRGTADQEQGSKVSGHKRNRDTAFPGPSAGSVQKKTAPGTTSHKHSVCVIGQPQARPLIDSSDRGEPYAETTKGSEFQRHNILATHRATAKMKVGKAKQPPLDRMFLDQESDQMQPGGRLDLRGPDESFWRTVTESVCPFCQKMFRDPEGLRVHLRSHRDKKSH